MLTINAKPSAAQTTLNLNLSRLRLKENLEKEEKYFVFHDVRVARCKFFAAHFCVRAIRRRVTPTMGIKHNYFIRNSQTTPTTLRILIRVWLASLRLSCVLLGYF